MSTQVTTAEERTEAQRAQSRRLQLNNARQDLASAARSWVRASDRGDRKGAVRCKRAVEKARADIAEAEAQLAELGALL